MKKFYNLILLLTFVIFTGQIIAGDTDSGRDKVDAKYKWDVTDLYPTDEAWQKAKADLDTKQEGFTQFKGKLAESADQLYNCLNFDSEVWKEYLRLSSYASRISDVDTREAGPLAMTQEIQQLGTKMSGNGSYIDPEILEIPKETIAKFMKQKKELRIYKQYIDNIQRMQDHTMSAEVEKVIAEAGQMRDTPYDIYGIFKNADMPRPEFTSADGETINLDDANYSLHRANPDQAYRKQVFETFFNSYKKFERTFGADLYSQVKKDIFYKNVKNYDSSLERALGANNIPTSVYKNLIAGVHENLPTLHRYLNLRKKMMGLDELHYYDMYPSLVTKVNMSYTVEEGQELIKAALKPLGKDYVATLDKAFNNRWIDMFPNTGKRSGAYSSGGAYDVHPYILMNYNGKYDDVSTLAHELGHTMHSFYSNKNQAFVNADYPIFLAEVASITNEALLVDHVLKNTTDKQKRLSILGNQLETFRTTLFRQTQFAEFELRIHEMAEKGEALTGEKLSTVYLDILRTYYGADKGITNIEDLYAIEWAYIPHFYYNFYVFQYATSLCAATAVSEKILGEGPEMSKMYLKNFLGAGSSDYAIPILKSIGVDMTTQEPFNLAMKRMNKIMDEIEDILKN